MKRSYSLLCAGVLFLAYAGSALAQGQISGSVHDFRGEAWAGATGTANDGDFCEVCHTPHNPPTDPGYATTVDAPLWNHIYPDTGTTASPTFTMYSSNTIQATAITAPNAGSLTCLGCHDGQTAMDNYGGTTTGTQQMGAVAANLGRDLSDDHPVSILYDNALFLLDNTLVDPASGGNTAAPLLRNDRVQCSSCHDPHGRPGLLKFLRLDNTGSNLCVQCHNK